MLARCFTARTPQFWLVYVVLSYFAILLRSYCSCSLSGSFCHLFILANTLIWHTVAHCYSSKTARSRWPCSQPTQWKKYGSWPTAFCNVAALETSGKEIQLGVAWNVRVTPSCLGGTGALKNIHVSMRWQLFSLLFLDTNRVIPTLTSRKAIRTTTLFSRQLTFTPSNDPFPGFFQLS